MRLEVVSQPLEQSVVVARIAGCKARGTWMLYEALCRQLGRTPRQDLQSLLPAPEVRELTPGQPADQALIKQLETFGNFDADGMFAPIDLGKDLSKGCFAGLIVHNGKWVRMAPTDTGYLC